MKYQRDTEAVRLYSFFLQRTVQFRPVSFQQRADLSLPYLASYSRILTRIVRNQIQLGNLLFKRHP